MAVIRTQFTLRLDPVNHAKIKKDRRFGVADDDEYDRIFDKKEIKRYEAENGEIPVTDDDIYLK